MSTVVDPALDAAVRSHARHDLSHQLATLRALVAAAADPHLDDAGRSRVLDSAREELVHASDLVVLLTGGTPVTATRGSTDLVDVLRASVAAHPAGRIDLQVEAGGAPTVEVALDRTAVVRVVRNLLGNALAAGPGGRVVLDLSSVPAPADGPPLVRLAVHDDGPGPGRRGFSRAGGSGLDVVRAQVLPAGGWLVLGRSPLGGAMATVVLPGAAS